VTLFILVTDFAKSPLDFVEFSDEVLGTIGVEEVIGEAGRVDASGWGSMGKHQGVLARLLVPLARLEVARPRATAACGNGGRWPVDSDDYG
jgi:hypothetical protein